MKNSTGPLDPLQHPRFGGIATFSRLPLDPELSSKPDAAILGVPFDGGTTFRPGARFGPRAIREASVLCRNYNPIHGVDIYKKLKVVDGGDIQTNPLNLMKTYGLIEAHIEAVLKKKTRPLCLGGDHSIALPILRAMHKQHGSFVLIHFDAHTDTGDQAWGEPHHHGTPIRRALEEKILKGSDIFQIGIRGPLTSPDQDTFVQDHKINVLPAEVFGEKKARDDFFARIHKHAKGRKCYLTFDVDGVDPAYAPGTGTPVVGGLTSREALQAVRMLKGLKFIGADVVEVSPPYDHSQLTSLLASALVFEFLSLMALD